MKNSATPSSMAMGTSWSRFRCSPILSVTMDANHLVAKASTFKAGAENFRMRREASQEERRRRGMYPAFWTAACGDTDYFATVTAPSRYADRLGEAGIDFSVLLPSIGPSIGGFADHDERVTLCLSLQRVHGEHYAPFQDRFTVAAAVPMGHPDEAIAELQHAKALGAKVALIPSIPPAPRWRQRDWTMARIVWQRGLARYVRVGQRLRLRPRLGDGRPTWLPLAAHSPGIGFSDRASVSNYMYNHAGHFAAAGEALAKSLFLAESPVGFPACVSPCWREPSRLGCACTSTCWLGAQTRRDAIGRLNPANIDRQRLAALLAESDPRFARYSPDEYVDVYGMPLTCMTILPRWGLPQRKTSQRAYCTNFYWGCEADDPLVGLAFDRRVMGSAAQVHPMMGSDIGHWDVPEFESPLAEAYELVEPGVLDASAFREVRVR